MCTLNIRGPTSWIACTTSVPANTSDGPFGNADPRRYRSRSKPGHNCRYSDRFLRRRHDRRRHSFKRHNRKAGYGTQPEWPQLHGPDDVGPWPGASAPNDFSHMGCGSSQLIVSYGGRRVNDAKDQRQVRRLLGASTGGEGCLIFKNCRAPSTSLVYT
jgi:hypothetical protein